MQERGKRERDRERRESEEKERERETQTHLMSPREVALVCIIPHDKFTRQFPCLLCVERLKLRTAAHIFDILSHTGEAVGREGGSVGSKRARVPGKRTRGRIERERESVGERTAAKQ